MNDHDLFKIYTADGRDAGIEEYDPEGLRAVYNEGRRFALQQALDACLDVERDGDRTEEEVSGAMLCSDQIRQLLAKLG